MFRVRASLPELDFGLAPEPAGFGFARCREADFGWPSWVSAWRRCLRASVFRWVAEVLKVTFAATSLWIYCLCCSLGPVHTCVCGGLSASRCL